MNNKLIVIFFMFILTGCSQQRNVLNPPDIITAESTVTISLKSSNTVQTPFEVTTQTPIPLQTLTPIFSSTIALSQVPAQTAIIDLTKTIFTPYLSYSNQNARDTVAKILATTDPKIRKLSTSPDHKWRVELVHYGCTCTQCDIPVPEEHSFDVLRLVRGTNSEMRQIATQLNLCWWIGNGLDELVWSPNSRYYYFADAYEDIPENRPPRWSRNFYRYDVNSRVVMALGPGVLSPDRKALATSEQPLEGQGLPYPKAFIVWDLDGQEIVRFDTHYSSGSLGEHHIAWSPITSNLVYVEKECRDEASCLSTIYYVDRLSGARSILSQKINLSIIGIYWDEPGKLLLIDDHYQQWIYTFADNTLGQKKYEK